MPRRGTDSCRRAARSTTLREHRGRAAIGGVIGPIGFVAAWLSTGFVKAHYSLLQDPISDLAGAHASTRPAMTAGFVVLAVGMCFYAWALHDALAGPAWITATITGLATLGVAAFPLHHSSTVDSVHGTFAGIGYVTLAATALLSAAPLNAPGSPRVGPHRHDRRRGQRGCPRAHAHGFFPRSVPAHRAHRRRCMGRRERGRDSAGIVDPRRRAQDLTTTRTIAA